jgi:REP element-mobilizing transposase RayT
MDNISLPPAARYSVWFVMTNHYHLLIETPNANLSRVMRHINGVYTQRYNRLKRIDGPLSGVATKLF